MRDDVTNADQEQTATALRELSRYTLRSRAATYAAVHRRVRRDLRALRVQRGLTQQMLSRLSGVTITTISNLENGFTQRVQARTLDALTAALRDRDSANVETDRVEREFTPEEVAAMLCLRHPDDVTRLCDAGVLGYYRRGWGIVTVGASHIVANQRACEVPPRREFTDDDLAKMMGMSPRKVADLRAAGMLSYYHRLPLSRSDDRPDREFTLESLVATGHWSRRYLKRELHSRRLGYYRRLGIVTIGESHMAEHQRACEIGPPRCGKAAESLCTSS